MNPADLVFLLAALIIAMVIFSVRSYRRHQETVARTFMECGYFEVPQVDDDIRAALHGPWATDDRRRRNRRYIGKAFRYNTGGMELYLFDPEPSESNNRTMVIRSSQLILPRFILSPKIPLGGRLGRFINLLSEKIISRQLPSIRLNLSPEFDARYYLFGNQPEEIKKVLDEPMLRWLESSDRRLMLSADRHLLTLSYFDVTSLKQLSKKRPLSGDYIREMTAIAKDVYQHLYQASRPDKAVTT